MLLIMIDKRLSNIIDGKKKCTLCLTQKPLDDFGKWYDKSREGVRYEYYYYTSRCKPCMSIASRQSALKNQPYIKERNRLWREKLKAIVYKNYGGICSCCGENNPLFLTVDHINNDGYKSRTRGPRGSSKSIIAGAWYKFIIDNNFPNDLQLLCYNCNCGKQRNKGVCPHASTDSV